MVSTGKYIITVLLLGFYSVVFAQFNTLMPKNVKLNETLNDKQSFHNKSAVKIEKEKKKIINNLFNAPTKKELKKEIDSLRTLMLLYNESRIGERESKTDSKIYKDSVFQSNKNQMPKLENANTERPVKKNELINEGEPYAKISMPLKKGILVTSPFGWRVHPILGAAKMHNGADFKASYENVYAILDGIVIASGWDSGGGGNYIKIKHSDSYVTSYLHLSETYYKTGEFVKAGFIVAKSGNTGNSTGAHLHFSVTKNGKYINPIHFLNDLIRANNLITTYYETGKNSYSQY